MKKLIRKNERRTRGRDTGIGFGTDGSNGNDTLLAKDTGSIINAYAGNDLLISSVGNDILIGGAGNDTYRYQRGDGADTLIDNSNGGAINTLELGSGISATDITFTYDSATQTVLLDLGGGDTLHIGNPDNLAVQQIKLADGSLLNPATILAQQGLIHKGTAGADTLQGSDSTAFGDVMWGAAGKWGRLDAANDEGFEGRVSA